MNMLRLKSSEDTEDFNVGRFNKIDNQNNSFICQIIELLVEICWKIL
jgi:hypothetical protein